MLNYSSDTAVMYTHGWTIEKVEDRYQVKYPSKYPNEVHEFKTQEYAEAHRRFCSRLEPSVFGFRAHNLYEFRSTNLAICGDTTLVNSNVWPTFELKRPDGTSILSVNQSGTILAFDLPAFVGAWIKSTFIYKTTTNGLKRFWYGEKYKKM